MGTGSPHERTCGKIKMWRIYPELFQAYKYFALVISANCPLKSAVSYISATCWLRCGSPAAAHVELSFQSSKDPNISWYLGFIYLKPLVTFGYNSHHWQSQRSPATLTFFCAGILGEKPCPAASVGTPPLLSNRLHGYSRIRYLV